MPRLTNDSDGDWERFGRTDPYFAVLSCPQYHGQLQDAERHAFFSSGEEHVEHVLSVIRDRLDPEFTVSRALDFGCGVGRIVIPLASVCSEVVGADVSESMLREARRNCDAAGVTNVHLVKNDDVLGDIEGSFDLVHSYIVLQHVPVRRGEQLVRRLLERVASGGVCVLHVTYAIAPLPRINRLIYWARTRIPGAHWLINLVLRRSMRSPLMQVNRYSVTRLLDEMWRQGCNEVLVRFSDHQGNRGAMLFGRKAPVRIFT